MKTMATKTTSSLMQGKKLGAIAVLVGSCFAGSAQAVALTGNVGYVSDYLFRGISQTNEGMALQGGFTVTADSGFYLSTWGSNIKFGNGSMELDILAGWTGKISEDWTIDVGAMQYRYPNGDNQTDQFNFNEFYTKLIYKDLVLGFAYSDDYFGTGVNEYYYLSADYTYVLHESLSLLLHLGQNQFEDNAQYNTFVAAGPLRGDAYLDWSVGLGTTVLGSAVQLKFASTNIEGSAGCNLCDGRLVLSLSKTF